jgi:RimJ/RimL family protein N-acetyltransferase
VLSFRPLTAEDLPLLHDWLNRDHVARWWHERPTPQQVADEYLPAIEGSEPTDVYVIVDDGRDVGMIQTYLIADYPEWEAVVQAGEGAAGVDLLIGEEELTGRGIGTRALRSFVRDVVFADPAIGACLADPEIGNAASLRAFEKAGFHHVRDFDDPAEGTRNALVRLDRQDIS